MRVETVSREFTAAVREGLHTKQREAQQASRAASEARQRAGIRALIPWSSARSEVRQKTEDADHAQRRLVAARDTYKDDIRDALGRAPEEAAARQREQRRWEAKPEVEAARERDRLNREVAQEVRSGDPVIIAAAAEGDLETARQEIIRREKEARREQERREREDLKKFAADLSQRGFPSTGPRPGMRR